MAARLARDIPGGWYVNLGLGLPTLDSRLHFGGSRSRVPFRKRRARHGTGAAKDQVDTWLINATKQNITLVKGASLFHHADSFGMIRGGHLDLCVLGAYEVARMAISPTGPHRRTMPFRPSAARWIFPRREASLGADGAHNERWAQPHCEALHLSANGRRCRKARLYKSRRSRRDGARL